MIHLFTKLALAWFAVTVLSIWGRAICFLLSRVTPHQKNQINLELKLELKLEQIEGVSKNGGGACVFCNLFIGGASPPV